MSAITKSIRNVFSRQQQEIKKELSDIQKLGIRFTLDMQNSARTGMILDTCNSVFDPLNDADFKIRKLFTLIQIQIPYIAVLDNPRIAPLISALGRIMSKWNILINEKRKAFGNFMVVDMEVPYELPNGQFLLSVQRESLSYPVFGHQTAQYLPGSEWQVEQMQRVYGKEESKDKPWKWLRLTPISAGIQKKRNIEPTQEEQEVMERTERFANTEIVYRMFTIYSWMHREKFTFPNTPIVIQGAPPMGGGFNPKQIFGTGSFPAAPGTEQGDSAAPSVQQTE